MHYVLNFHHVLLFLMILMAFKRLIGGAVSDLQTVCNEGHLI